jgi:DNA-binding PadR family transcriptional regulator
MFNPLFHEHARHARLFHRGDMKYVILDLLKDKPAHGYEIIQTLEERFRGFYSPNAGSIYPVLQLLEDMGYVTSNVADGKKVYTINEAGRAFLREQQETTDKIKGRLKGWWGSDSREYLKDIRIALNYTRDIRSFIGHVAIRKDPSKIAKINEILAKVIKDLEEIYGESSPRQEL